MICFVLRLLRITYSSEYSEIPLPLHSFSTELVSFASIDMTAYSTSKIDPTFPVIDILISFSFILTVRFRRLLVCFSP